MIDLDPSNFASSEFLRSSEVFQDIEDISFAKCHDSVDDDVVINAVRRCPRLRHLTLNGCAKVTDAALLALAEHNLMLNTLSAMFCPLISDAAVLAVVKATRLLSLNVIGSQAISPACVAECKEYRSGKLAVLATMEDAISLLGQS